MSNKLPFLLIGFLFLLSLLYPSNINAATLQIDTSPSSVTAGNEFTVTFSASDLEPSVLYYAKGFGGIDFEEVDTWSDKTSSYLQQNASWLNMPEFTSGGDGTGLLTLKARFQSSSQGSKNFKVRIRKANVDPNYDSTIVTIQVDTATPSPSPTPTATPTATPTPTPNPTPTKTPTPKPTAKPTPLVLSGETGPPPPSNSEVLGLRGGLATTDPEAQVGSSETKKSFPILSWILILFGVSLISFTAFRLFLNMKEGNKGYTNNSESQTGQNETLV